ncbi:MAG: nucleotide exchange factor GrpE [Candidatus Onthovivens sp.]|nr:nucleotide exchange factor GrpE [Candidatus Onthovivens sp.]
MENKEEKVQEKTSATQKEDKKEERNVEEELLKAKSDAEHWKNEYYKAYADMANLRKQIEKDHRESLKYRIEGFAENLLSILDAFDMALKNKPTTTEMKNYLIGFEYVHNSLLSVLENEGIQILEPKIGDKFDENTMHAVEATESDGEENLITEVRMKGYKLHDHLIRAAMVAVSKHPSPKDEKAEDKREEESQAKE